ncbi:hypothetical protein D3C85_1652190 [compost metagenome]
MKLMIVAALIIAAAQYLPMEALIVAALVPVAMFIAKPIARGVEAFMTARG